MPILYPAKWYIYVDLKLYTTFDDVFGVPHVGLVIRAKEKLLKVTKYELIQTPSGINAFEIYCEVLTT